MDETTLTVHSRFAMPRACVALLLAGSLAGCDSGVSLQQVLVERGASCVVIVIDATAARHLGSYGYRRATTPHIDALADEGILFERAYAQAPSTILSVPSYLTGLQPHAIALRREQRASLAYLPEAFSSAGFRTAAFSQNLNVGLSIPGPRAFDHFDGYVPGQARRQPSATRLVDRALQWIAESPEEPFFLYLHLLPPHSPYAPPPKYRVFDGRARQDAPVPTSALLAEIDLGTRTASSDDIDHIVARYDANLRFADELVASFLAGLEEQGWADRSVVVVTSDHGEAFGEHGRFLHNSTLYDEMLRVPLVFRLPPGVGAAGTRVSSPVSLVDLAPTLEDLFGLGSEIATQAAGTTLVPRLAGRGGGPARAVLAQREGQVMILDDEMKLIANTSGDATDELYDLRTDPDERDDLSSSAHPRAAQLRSRVEPMLDDRVAGIGLVEGLLEQLPEEAARQLQALGYLLKEQRQERDERQEGGAARPAP